MERNENYLHRLGITGPCVRFLLTLPYFLLVYTSGAQRVYWTCASAATRNITRQLTHTLLLTSWEFHALVIRINVISFTLLSSGLTSSKFDLLIVRIDVIRVWRSYLRHWRHQSLTLLPSGLTSSEFDAVIARIWLCERAENSDWRINGRDTLC